MTNALFSLRFVFFSRLNFFLYLIKRGKREIYMAKIFVKFSIKKKEISRNLSKIRVSLKYFPRALSRSPSTNDVKRPPVKLEHCGLPVCRDYKVHRKLS